MSYFYVQKHFLLLIVFMYKFTSDFITHSQIGWH